MGSGIDSLRGRMIRVPDGRYLLGLSGGADSVALLYLLLPETNTGRIQLEAVHVNHGLRDEESDGDERFCKSLCASEGIDFKACHADLRGKKDENSARKARYSAFRQRLDETGYDGLILAHHADDQAETFLMRLLRGAGPDGLEGMKADTVTGGIRIIRPMLNLRRDEIRRALRSDGIRWREDSTNSDTAYLRNRIRTDLIPMMERITNSAVAKISTAATLIAVDNEALTCRARDLLSEISAGPVLNAEKLRVAEPALQSRALRLWWRMYGPELEERSLNTAQTMELLQLLGSNRGKINLPGDTHAVRAGRWLFLETGAAIPAEPVMVRPGETVFGEYRLTATPSEGNPGDGKRTQEVPRGFLEGCVIRTRRQGDRIRPFGSGGSRKLQDYLTDRRIAEPFRDHIPLICREHEVLLVAGVGAGDIPRWNANHSPVRLTWHGQMPWLE